MIRNPLQSLITMLCLSAMPIAHATDAIVCSGKIEIVGVHSTDRVILRLAGMNTVVHICNLSADLGTYLPVSGEQCRAAYSTLLTAYSLDKTVSVTFENVVNGTSCTNFVGWEVATARWVYLDSGGP